MGKGQLCVLSKMINLYQAQKQKISWKNKLGLDCENLSCGVEHCVIQDLLVKSHMIGFVD